MFFLQVKSVRVYVTLLFAWAILCVACAEGEDAVKKDAKNEGPKDPPKEDAKNEGFKDLSKEDTKDKDSKDSPKEDTKDEKSTDSPQKDTSDKDLRDSPKGDDEDNSTKQDSDPKDSQDRPKTQLEQEAELIFLTPHEAKDFFGIGPMFEDPEYHKFLMQEYVTMEATDYWELRCNEKVTPNKYTHADSASFEKPAYCA